MTTNREALEAARDAALSNIVCKPELCKTVDQALNACKQKRNTPFAADGTYIISDEAITCLDASVGVHFAIVRNQLERLRAALTVEVIDALADHAEWHAIKVGYSTVSTWHEAALLESQHLIGLAERGHQPWPDWVYIDVCDMEPQADQWASLGCYAQIDYYEGLAKRLHDHVTFYPVDEYTVRIRAEWRAATARECVSDNNTDTQPFAGQRNPKPLIDELVTLNQVAPLTGLRKRTLEGYVNKDGFPEPDVKGGGGKANKWYWSNLRPGLAKLSRKSLPSKFPGTRIIDDDARLTS